MLNILDIITDWIKGILRDCIMGNLDGMFDQINSEVGEVAANVGTTPAAWNAGVFSMIRNLSDNVVVPIAGMIITFVLCYELISMLMEKNNFPAVPGVDVKIYLPKDPDKDHGKLMGFASVSLGGVFAVNNIRIYNTENGPYVSMPSTKGQDGKYHDICCPTTKEMRQALNAAVLSAYEKAVEEKISGMIADTKQNIEKVENIGHELRSVGGHLKNAGRAMTGKETQTVDSGQEGRFQSVVLAPMRATKSLLSSMNNATLAAIGGMVDWGPPPRAARAVSFQDRSRSGGGAGRRVVGVAVSRS